MQEDIIDMYKSALPAYESEIEYLRTEKRHMKERYDFILKKNAQLELENERLRRQNQELESHWNNRMTEEPPDLVGDDDRDHHFASSPFAYYQNK
jgi:regulator of replication initiation timing